MAGKCRPSLRGKTLENVKHSNLSQTDKDCIAEVFKRYEKNQREGEWYQHTKKEHGDTCYYCSACEKMALLDGMCWEFSNYCPNCGAKMKGANNDR